jgi:hypothetical protein
MFEQSWRRGFAIPRAQADSVITPRQSAASNMLSTSIGRDEYRNEFDSPEVVCVDHYARGCCECFLQGVFCATSVEVTRRSLLPAFPHRDANTRALRAKLHTHVRQLARRNANLVRRPLPCLDSLLANPKAQS